jgi:HAD superfamily hydrolase (TIGR01549 family)
MAKAQVAISTCGGCCRRRLQAIVVNLPLTRNGVFSDLEASPDPTLTTLIFDFDGTLVNSFEAKKDAFMHAMATCGQGSREQYEQLYSTHGAANRIELLRRSFADVCSRNPSGAESVTLTAEYARHYRSRLNEIALFPGFVEFYNRFQNRYRFAVASNAPRDEVVEICRSLGIEHFFVRIYGHPMSKMAALHEVIDEFGIEPPNILYVGDRVEDRIAAQTVGTRFCMIDHIGVLESKQMPVVTSFIQLANLICDFGVPAET